MSIEFSADEVLAMAGRIETTGAKFYRKAAKFHVAGSDLLMQIAGQEDIHFKTFAEMRQKLAANEKENTAYDPYGESDLYLKAMVDGYAFNINQDPVDLITGKESLMDIFKMAIALEKDSIAFYLGLQKMVPLAFGKGRLDEIIQEEMKHISWLAERRAGLSVA